MLSTLLYSLYYYLNGGLITYLDFSSSVDYFKRTNEATQMARNDENWRRYSAMRTPRWELIIRQCLLRVYKSGLTKFRPRAWLHHRAAALPSFIISPLLSRFRSLLKILNLFLTRISKEGTENSGVPIKTTFNDISVLLKLNYNSFKFFFMFG